MADAQHVHTFEHHLSWTGAAAGPVRDYASYSRDFAAAIAGKPLLPLSGATAFRGDGTRHNPEDLLVIALSSCHALSYLALAAKYKIEVLSYEDDAVGEMKKVGLVYRFTSVLLKPKVTIRKGNDVAKALSLHEKAHHECFIANSVNFEVRNESVVREEE